MLLLTVLNEDRRLRLSHGRQPVWLPRLGIDPKAATPYDESSRVQTPAPANQAHARDGGEVRNP
jgi:hypothetical protein